MGQEDGVIYADLKFPPRLQQTDVKKAESQPPAQKTSLWAQLAIVVVLCVLFLVALISLSVLYSQLLARNTQLLEESKQAKSKMEQVEGRYSQLLQWTLHTNICALESPSSNTSEPHNVSCSLCPCQWISNKGRCYYFSPTMSPWSNSRSSCQKEQADLVIINDREEQVFLSQRKRQLIYWIGLTDVAKEDLWKWVDGTDLNQEKFWYDSQPDNYLDEDCATLTNQLPLPHNWNDDNCNKRLHYICEKAAVTLTIQASSDSENLVHCDQ
ncbi:CD209 antigen-like protein E [Mauremys reevesii]|uniref:CD209 antigen-like protein E n=1 Tax=Mauremys reevesii TaxID=260615 RepID=UPI00193FFAAC|nr:CD209 antigen-like protein E [Mauremys reevesii]